MLNQRNYGIYEGRLAQDPVFFSTAGGAESVILKVGCRRNYTSKGADEPESDFAEFRGYIPANNASHGVYGFLHTGDLVSIQYSLRTGSSEKDGERTYYQSCQIENLEIKEGRQVREERYASRNAAEATFRRRK